MTKEILRCSFCNKAQCDVKKLISGPVVYICDECVEVCKDILLTTELTFEMGLDSVVRVRADDLELITRWQSVSAGSVLGAVQSSLPTDGGRVSIYRVIEALDHVLKLGLVQARRHELLRTDQLISDKDETVQRGKAAEREIDELRQRREQLSRLLPPTDRFHS